MKHLLDVRWVRRSTLELQTGDDNNLIRDLIEFAV